MGAKLSPVRENVPLLEGMELLSRGKVRDTYGLGEDLLLVLASDGISIFDFVLNALVAHKGEVLTALTIFWGKILRQHFPTHLQAWGEGVGEDFGPALQERGLLSRTLVVKRLKMFPVELIARGYLTGSGLAAYQRDGAVCGHRLLPGLEDGDRLPLTLDTPTTKAEEGHDEHIGAQAIASKYPEATLILLRAYELIHRIALERRVILADTKLEFGIDRNGQLMIGDEFFTPDSSRFWDALEWEDSRRAKSPRKAPAPYDKQFVREWGKGERIHELDPKNPEHVAKVHSLVVPQEVLDQTRQIYRYIFWRLTGMILERFQRSEMGLEVPLPKRRVDVILGSESDKRFAEEGMGNLIRALGKDRVRWHVLSCHRNPDALVNFLEEVDTDLLIAAGGKALALPGIAASWLRFFEKPIPVVGVAFGEQGSSSLEAARLSITELPDRSVVTDDAGQAFEGPEGFLEACDLAIDGEFPPVKLGGTKEPQFNMGPPGY